LEGIISVREIQGGGRSNITFLSDQLITWNTATSRLPDEFAFRYLLPTFSRDGRLLPPTLDSRLTGIPGFRVSVKWTISVTATRALSNPLSFFRRTARCVSPMFSPVLAFTTHTHGDTRLSVPIGYVPRTRPPSRGPFPMSPSRILPSPTATLFTDLVPPRREGTPPIQTQVTFSFPFILCDIRPFALTWPGFPLLQTDLPPTLADYASYQGHSFPHRTLCPRCLP
jgi:hypothetical protein